MPEAEKSFGYLLSVKQVKAAWVPGRVNMTRDAASKRLYQIFERAVYVL